MKMRKLIKKRFGAVLLAGAVALSLLPMSALAADDNTFAAADLDNETAQNVITEYVQAFQFLDMAAGTENVLDHFFDGTPSPLDAYGITQWMAMDEILCDAYYDAENVQHVVPYGVVAELAARYFTTVPDMKSVDAGLLGVYDAESDSFVIPFGGFGNAPYAVELMGVRTVIQGDAEVYEIYAKVSYVPVDEEPDMSNENDYAKCVLTVTRNGDYYRYLSLSQIDQFPSEYGAPTVVARDEETSVVFHAAASAIPEGAVMTAASITAGDSFDLVKGALDTDVFTLYDLSLSADGVSVQPKGTLTITLPLPQGYDAERVAVYHVASDGTVTEMEVQVSGDGVTFETDHLSLYAVAEKPDAAEPGTDGETEQPVTPAAPVTPDSNPNTGDRAVAVGAAALLGTAVLVITKKKFDK